MNGQEYNYIKGEKKRLPEGRFIVVCKKMIDDYEQVTKAKGLVIEGYEYIVSEFINEKIADHIIMSLCELKKVKMKS